MINLKHMLNTIENYYLNKRTICTKHMLVDENNIEKQKTSR